MFDMSWNLPGQDGLRDRASGDDGVGENGGG
jgi:hypothetical protein